MNCYLCGDENEPVSSRVENIYLWSIKVVKSMVSGRDTLGPEPGFATY